MQNFRILTLIVIGLLSQTMISSAQYNEYNYRTYSDEINQGDSYSWTVEEFTIPEYSTAIPANNEEGKVPLASPKQNTNSTYSDTTYTTSTTVTSTTTAPVTTTVTSTTTSTTYYSTEPYQTSSDYTTSSSDYSTTATAGGYSDFRYNGIERGDTITLEVLRDPHDTNQNEYFDYDRYFLISINGEETSTPLFASVLIFPVVMVFEDGHEENYLEFITETSETSTYENEKFRIIGDEFQFEDSGEGQFLFKYYIDKNSGLMTLFENKDDDSWLKIVGGSGLGGTDSLANLIPINYYSLIYGITFISFLTYRKRKSKNK